MVFPSATAHPLPAPSERRIRPSALRRVAFFGLGVAAVFARVATWPGRRALRRHAAAAAPGAPERVFLLEPYGLGDAIALQPLVRALCEAGRDVAVGTRRAWFPVFPPHPCLTLVESVPPWAERDERRKYRGLFRRLRAYLPTLRSAARGRVGIDPRGDVRSILALYAAGCVRVETLMHYATANDCLVLPGAAHRHPVRRDVARWRLNGVFAPDLPLSRPDLRFLLPPSTPAPASTRPRVAMIPLSPWIGKRWRPEGWRDVARGLRERGAEPYALCGPGEEDEAREAIGDAGVPVRVCGDIAAWVGALSGASAAIAVNTGPMHVASAIGIPVVLLEGSSRLPLWQPPCPPFSIVTHQAEISCAPCHQVGDGRGCRFRCMAAITAEEVLRAYDDSGRSQHLDPDPSGSTCILPRFEI